jgi:hypothetical protein
MKLLIIILNCLLTLNLLAQNITHAEYFFDSDPGFGNGTPVTVTASPDITLNFAADISTINDGFHVLCFRVRDDSARWSLAYAKPFLKLSPVTVSPTITELEYFIDTDPGFGNGTAIAITPAQDMTVYFTIDLSLLADGFHLLYVRGKDAQGKWSIAFSKPFYKETLQTTLSNIIQIEHFIDTDPGFGNGVNVPITAGHNISHTFAADLSNLANGFHILYVRGRDEQGIWSLAFSRPFYKEVPLPLNNITEVEYYFSNVDIITPVSKYSAFTAAPDVDVNFSADISSLARNTSFYMHVSGIDSTGLASLQYTHEFFIESTNNPPVVAIQLSDIYLKEDFGTAIIADLDTIFTDPDIIHGDSLRYSLILNSSKVNGSINQSILELTSVSDSNGVVPVIVRAEDDSLASVRDTFLVTIQNMNDPPIISGLPDTVTFEADTSVVVDIWSCVTDLESADNLLHYLFEPTAPALVAWYDSASGELTISSLANTDYSAPIYMTVTDDSGATARDSIRAVVIGVVGIADEPVNQIQIPKEFVLMQNYPNPFNPVTTIRFGLPHTARITIILYNILGQRVAVLADGEFTSGYHELALEVSQLGSGLYFYQMKAERFNQIRKLMIIK